MQVTKTPMAPVVSKVKEDIDRVFDRFFPRLLEEPVLFPFQKEAAELTWMPAIDLVEDEKEYTVKLEVPGIHKENLDISMTGNVLTVTGHREQAKEKKGENFLWQEREIGKFRRTVRLPAAVITDKVDATYQDGILTIVLPKREPVAANKILVK